MDARDAPVSTSGKPSAPIMAPKSAYGCPAQPQCLPFLALHRAPSNLPRVAAQRPHYLRWNAFGIQNKHFVRAVGILGKGPAIRPAPKMPKRSPPPLSRHHDLETCDSFLRSTRQSTHCCSAGIQCICCLDQEGGTWRVRSCSSGDCGEEYMYIKIIS